LLAILSPLLLPLIALPRPPIPVLPAVSGLLGDVSPEPEDGCGSDDPVSSLISARAFPFFAARAAFSLSAFAVFFSGDCDLRRGSGSPKSKRFVGRASPGFALVDRVVRTDGGTAGVWASAFLDGLLLGFSSMDSSFFGAIVLLVCSEQQIVMFANGLE